MHNAGMPAITIRNVPDDTRNELAARAARSGRSLQEYLKAELVRLASTPTMEDWLALVREQKEQFGGRLSAKDILAARDADRR